MSSPLPCPLCSVPALKLLAEPQWAPAWRTSQKRGVKCAFLTGCPHLVKFGAWQIVELPAAAALLTLWDAEAERLCAARTAAWSESDRALYRTALGFPAQPVAA